MPAVHEDCVDGRQTFVFNQLKSQSYNCFGKVHSHFRDVECHCSGQGNDHEGKKSLNRFNKIGSPPQPVLTLGSWMNAAEYYIKNLLEVLEIVRFSEEDGSQIGGVKAAENDCKVAESLFRIRRDYQMFTKPVDKLDSFKYTLISLL